MTNLAGTPENRCMWSAQRPGKRLVLVAVALVVLLALHPIGDTVSTVRLLVSLNAAAKGQVDNEGIERLDLRLAAGDQRRAILYRRHSQSPSTTILFVPGLNLMGADHPRLVTLAKTLTARGCQVLTPDIEEFRAFRFTEIGLQEIILWYEYARSQFPAAKAGMAGISVAGTLALMAAARPGIRENVAFVVSIGGYQDLQRCHRQWFSSRASEQKHGQYPVHYYGRWISMLAALNQLADAQDRREMDRLLRHLLATGELPARPPELSLAGQRWYALAVGRPAADPQLIREIEAKLIPYFQSLAPDAALAQVICPVFLVHGAGDELIPTSETVELQKRLVSARSYVLLTPFISHTHPQFERVSGQYRWRGYLNTFRFLYAFSHWQSISGPPRIWEML